MDKSLDKSHSTSVTYLPEMTVSPLAIAFASAGQIVVGSALLYAGMSKLRDLAGARVAVLEYRAVPASLSGPAALGIAALEAGTGLGVIVGLPAATAFGILLLALLTLTAASALARGFDMDCHCGEAQEKLSVRTLQRNAFFVVILLVALLLKGSVPGPPASLLYADLAQAVLAAMVVLLFAMVSVVFRLLLPAAQGGSRT